MDTGFLEDVRGKLGLARASRPVLIGMAALLAIAAVAVGYVLSGTAAASDFELNHSSEASQPVNQEAERATVYVHVSGAVHEPGLYELELGSRVADAVNAAGGFAEDAAEESCNLARMLEDGEHVIVSSRSSFETIQTGEQAPESTNGPALVNLNTATAAQLESLPGIGSSTAQKIIADRSANGPFKSVSDLTRVSGIGSKKADALEGLVCV